MFARTSRLTLRPGWPEDAPALAAAIGHREVVERLAYVPWPYCVEDAARFLALPRDHADARFLIWSHEAAVPRLVGGIELAAREKGHELGYWLTPDAWGRGIATEAGRAVLDMARHALPVRRVVAYPHADNPASARVLRNLGLHEVGRDRRPALARGGEVDSLIYALDLEEPRPMAMAA